MLLKKNIIRGKINFIIFIFVFVNFILLSTYSENKEINQAFAEINILDKVSSKSSNIKIKIGEAIIFQNLEINILKCQNSQFDDNPEVTAYMQVKDLVSKNKDQVFIFNDWTFASSPSLRPFDHPVYDIWLKKCFN